MVTSPLVLLGTLDVTKGWWNASSGQNAKLDDDSDCTGGLVCADALGVAEARGADLLRAGYVRGAAEGGGEAGIAAIVVEPRTGDRPDWQPNSGKSGRKSVPGWSVPGALAQSDEARSQKVNSVGG